MRVVIDGGLCVVAGFVTAARLELAQHRTLQPRCDCCIQTAVLSQAIAAELAQDEAKHVAWLQSRLGIAAIPMPQVCISTGRIERAITKRICMRSSHIIVPADFIDRPTPSSADCSGRGAPLHLGAGRPVLGIRHAEFGETAIAALML